MAQISTLIYHHCGLKCERTFTKEIISFLNALPFPQFFFLFISPGYMRPKNKEILQKKKKKMGTNSNDWIYLCFQVTCKSGCIWNFAQMSCSNNESICLFGVNQISATAIQSMPGRTKAKLLIGYEFISIFHVNSRAINCSCCSCPCWD